MLRPLFIFTLVGLQLASCNPSLHTTLPGHDQTRRQADAVIVGAGISGLTAALELGRGGARVTVVEMSSVFGGHAVMSQGGLSIVGTPLQKSQGIIDTPELAYNDFMTWGEDADPEWVRYYVENSRVEIYDWLRELGVKFDPEVVTAPGNTVNRQLAPIGRGVGLVTPIYRGCLENDNVEIAFNTKAERLLVEDGRVVGLVVRDTRKGELREIRTEAVILATGGFQNNLEMVREFWPAEFRFPDRILVGSGKNSVGYGHGMAQAAGANLVKMDYQWNYHNGIPDPRHPSGERGLSAGTVNGVIVNKEGRRFANPHQWSKGVMPALLKQDPATLWLIFDEAARPSFTVSGSDWADFATIERLVLNNTELVQSAATYEQLAAKVGLPPSTLAETMTRYNELVERGIDEDFGRFGPDSPDFANEESPKLETPPFYAMQMYPLTRKSMGGVAIDLQCRVVDKERRPIPGLYAVGELTGLAGINGKAALEGTFLGPCIVTGRVAARAILKEQAVVAPVLPEQATRCTSCHVMKTLLAKPREGYWHFEKVHTVVTARGTDCRQCHSDLAPYRPESHRIDRQTLASACVRCHLAQE